MIYFQQLIEKFLPISDSSARPELGVWLSSASVAKMAALSPHAPNYMEAICPHKSISTAWSQANSVPHYYYELSSYCSRSWESVTEQDLTVLVAAQTQI